MKRSLGSVEIFLRSIFWLFFLRGITVSWAIPVVWNVVPQNMHFTGRAEEIDRIAQQFSKGASLIVLTGSPGVGKSQVAKQYLYRAGTNYEVVWWLQVNKTLAQQFERLSLELNKFLPPDEQINPKKLSAEQLIEVIKDLLRKRGLKCLFVFDNVTNLQTISHYLPFSNQGCTHILVTSCKRVTSYPSIAVRHFSSLEAIAFLQKMLPKESEERYQMLARYFSGHPLALAIAASFIASHPSVSVSTYLAAYTIEKQVVLAGQPNLFVDQYENDLHAILRLMLRSLKEQSPEALRVIQFLSCLHPQQVPFSYVASWLERSGAQQSADHIIGILFDHSLLEVEKGHNTQEKVRLSMHELIHKIIYAQLSDQEKRALLPQAIQVASEPFHKRNDLMIRSILREPEHLQHAARILNEAKKLRYHSGALLSLRVRVLYSIMGGFRDFEKANELVNDIYADQRMLRPVPLPHPDLVFALPQESLNLLDQSLLESVLAFFAAASAVDYGKALKHENRALQLIEKFPEKYEQKIRAVTSIIHAYVCQGALSSAERFVEIGKALLPYSQSDSYNAFFLYGWVFFLVESGQLEEALRVLVTHEGIASKIQDHPTMLAYVLIWKARALLEAGKRQECNRILDETRKSLEKFFGAKSPPLIEYVKVLQILSNLHKDASLPQAIKTLQGSFQVYSKAWKGKKKHRAQAFAWFVLGQAYERLGNSQKAMEAYQESEEIWDTILKEKRILDVSQLYSALGTLGLKIKNSELARTYLRKSIDIFGLNHSGTLKIVKYALDHKLHVPY